MLPAIVVLSAEINLDEGTPLRPLGLADKMHAGFGRSTVGFAGVTTNAGAHDVFPGSGAATIAWHHVVEIQIFAIEKLPAVLAEVFIPLENVVAGELHLFLGH